VRGIHTAPANQSEMMHFEAAFGIPVYPRFNGQLYR
jgi:hypothetical protein